MNLHIDERVKSPIKVQIYPRKHPSFIFTPKIEYCVFFSIPLTVISSNLNLTKHGNASRHQEYI